MVIQRAQQVDILGLHQVAWRQRFGETGMVVLGLTIEHFWQFSAGGRFLVSFLSEIHGQT
jgi:hypothetical protein